MPDRVFIRFRIFYATQFSVVVRSRPFMTFNAVTSCSRQGHLVWSLFGAKRLAPYACFEPARSTSRNTHTRPNSRIIDELLQACCAEWAFDKSFPTASSRPFTYIPREYLLDYYYIRDDLVGPCMDQVEAGFDMYLMHSNGNPLVYDKVKPCERRMPAPTFL